MFIEVHEFDDEKEQRAIVCVESIIKITEYINGKVRSMIMFKGRGYMAVKETIDEIQKAISIEK